MTRQLSIFDTEAASVGNGLTISHHLNHAVIRKLGLHNSDRGARPGVLRGVLDSGRRSLDCIERIDCGGRALAQ